jgi:hypothetical protein
MLLLRSTPILRHMPGEQRPPLAHAGGDPALLRRDVALHRVAQTRRWLITGAAGLAAGLAALAASAAPGRSQTAKPQSPATGRTRVVPSAASATQLPPLASPSELGLQPPGQAPASVAPDVTPAPAQQASPAQAAPAQQQASPAPSGAAVSGGS